ncbi:hypothetical protein HK096_004004 [Nowakowskiella sp. JEL0078]|nr:hypothetical protein HK096_004004 [Nowakowskiella sp. JEL0078]
MPDISFSSEIRNVRDFNEDRQIAEDNQSDSQSMLSIQNTAMPTQEIQTESVRTEFEISQYLPTPSDTNASTLALPDEQSTSDLTLLNSETISILKAIFFNLLAMVTFFVFIMFQIKYRRACDQPLSLYLWCATITNLIISPSAAFDIFVLRYPDVERFWGVRVLWLLWTTCRVFRNCWLIVGSFWVSRVDTCGLTNPNIYWFALLTVACSWSFVVISAIVSVARYLYRQGRFDCSTFGGIMMLLGNGFAFELNEDSGLNSWEMRRLKTFEFTEKMFISKKEMNLRSISLSHLEDQELDLNNNSEKVTRLSINLASLIEESNENSKVIPSLNDYESCNILSNFTCSICQTDYEISDMIRELGCLHQFHKDCVDIWLRSDLKTGRLGNRFCPLCKRDASLIRHENQISNIYQSNSKFN